MRCRTSLAFSTGQTTRRPNRRVRLLWRYPARVKAFHPQDDALRTLGCIPIHALIPFAGIEITHQPWGTFVPDQCPRRIWKYTLTRRYTLIVARESLEPRRRLIAAADGLLYGQGIRAVACAIVAPIY